VPTVFFQHQFLGLLTKESLAANFAVMDIINGDDEHQDTSLSTKAQAHRQIANSQIMDTLELILMSKEATCDHVADLWFNICSSLFHAEDGYEVVIQVDSTDPDIIQRVIVFEEEALAKSSLEEVPTGKLVPGPHRTVVYQEMEDVQALSVRLSARNVNVRLSRSTREDTPSSATSQEGLPIRNNEVELQRA
jgi:hypothetical protein